MEETAVIIVGAGPAGLATAACLKKLSIPHIVLEKEECLASLWRNRSYDRLHLHLAKEFCALPYAPHSAASPTYIPKDAFIRYLDDYALRFGISPRYRRCVEAARFDDAEGKWHVVARREGSGEVEEYTAPFLVVASGDNAEGYVPVIPGKEVFGGEIVHSREYKSGKKYEGKEVLVIGCGNSGMEIAYDVSNYGGHASIVVRSPVHVFTRDMIRAGMTLLNYLPLYMVDMAISWCGKLKYGDLSSYGLRSPADGPFYLKAVTGKSPVIDVGTIHKIKTGEIKVVPAIHEIKERSVVFEDGREQNFDAIVFATGYMSSAAKWLKKYNKRFLRQNELSFECFYMQVGGKNGYGENGNGNAKWKGEEKGLYMAGFSKKGILGIKMDAEAIASDIEMTIKKLGM
ncbi:probable indole-3-pyruvate monooxygenase YUCCA10 [Ipomoea triloba]|uniref:probable indole-3-pyruvate monooxygenase YUCCA10 n=1 Tax=Ipomoea triloba TaxID=35885 RepID=UPI00125CF267|nr:probable indole-3-pyruvate monooxygenase YUCCA10 [Ipomoea triloba]